MKTLKSILNYSFFKKQTIAQKLKIKQFPFEIWNKKGNIIYKEFEDNSWARWEYNLQGHQIYYENSKNYWEKKEYDSKGKKIYYEDSEGVIIKYPAIKLNQKHKLKFKKPTP